MSNRAVIALIVCGSCCVLAPWVYSAYYLHEVAHLLGADGPTRVNIYNEAQTALKWFSVWIGIGMIVIDQHPHLISSAALGNTFATLCLNQRDPTDINKAAALSLVAEQDKRWFSMLPIGRAIAKLQDRWRRPFLIQIPLVKVRKG